MANSENTAVNDLIARVSGGAGSSPSAPSGPVSPGAAGPPSAPGHRGHPGHPMRAALPVAPPFEGPLPTSYPVVPRGLIEPPRAPSPPSPSPSPPPPPPSPPPSPPIEPYESADPTWVTGPPRHARFGKPEHMVGTLVVRRSEKQVLFGKLVLPMALLVVVGMLAGGYVAIYGLGGSSRARPGGAERPAIAAAVEARPAAPAASAQVAPVEAAPNAPSPAAPPPVAAPVQIIAKPAGLVDVRIDSTPRGATVMLVDHGRTQLVGNTPINAAFDPSREYDLVFTYPDQPTLVEHLVPSTTTRLAVTLGAPATQPSDPARSRRAHRTAPAAPAGQGTLMISTKPPCEISIDGAATGLTTPQRAISLPAGRHELTLVNREQEIHRTLSVEIAADATAKIVEDLLP